MAPGKGAHQEGSPPSTIIVVSDIKYAMGLIRARSTPQQYKEYALQVRQDFVALKEAWPGTKIVWSWQKSHTKETTRKTKGTRGRTNWPRWACGWHSRNRALQPRPAGYPSTLPYLPYCPFPPQDSGVTRHAVHAQDSCSPGGAGGSGAP